MSTDVNQLLLKIDASTELARREISKLDPALERLATRADITDSRIANLQTGFSRIATAARAALPALTALTAVGLARSAIISAAAYQQLEAQLLTATGSAQAAGAAFEQLQRFAAETPFSLEEITRAFVLLKNLGLDPSEEALRSYGNTAGALGKTLDDVIQAVADATVGEFERLKEFGIKAKTEGDRITFTFRGVSTTVAKEARAIEGFLQGIGNTQFAGGIERQAKTIDGQLSNLRDSAQRLGATFANITGFSDLFIAGIESVNNDLADTESLLQRIAKASPLRRFLDTVDRALGVDPPKPRATGPSKAERDRAKKTLDELRAQGLQGSALFQSLSQDFERRFGETPELVVTAGRLKPKPKPAPAAGRTGGRRALPRAVDDSDFMPAYMEGGWALRQLLAEGTPASVELTNQALQSVAETLRGLDRLDFTVEPLGREQLELAQEYAATLNNGLVQAAVNGRGFLSVLEGIGKQILASGLLNILSGGALGTSFGTSLGALGQVFGGFFATGGRPPVGKVSVVGERGPELFVPRVPGEIIPSYKLAGMMRGDGGQTEVIVRTEPSPLFVTTVVQGARAAASDQLRRATRPRMIASAGA